MYATATLAIIGTALTYALSVNLLSMFESTMCLKFIGGFEATGLYLDECDTEPAICAQTRCASS